MKTLSFIVEPRYWMPASAREKLPLEVEVHAEPKERWQVFTFIGGCRCRHHFVITSESVEAWFASGMVGEKLPTPGAEYIVCRCWGRLKRKH